MGEGLSRLLLQLTSGWHKQHTPACRGRQGRNMNLGSAEAGGSATRAATKNEENVIKLLNCISATYAALVCNNHALLDGKNKSSRHVSFSNNHLPHMLLPEKKKQPDFRNCCPRWCCWRSHDLFARVQHPCPLCHQGMYVSYVGRY